MIVRRTVAAFALFWCASVFAAVPGRRLIIPVAGRVTAAGGIEYKTTLYITNPSSRTARVSIAFLAAGQPNPNPVGSTLTLASHATAVLHNVTEELLQRPGLGALLIRSDRRVIAESRIAWTPAGAGEEASQGASFSGIPIARAISRGGSAVLHGAGSGPDPAFRYNIHLVEANGTPASVLIAVETLDGRQVGQKKILLRQYESVIIPLTTIASKPPPDARVRVRMIRGGGKVVAAGSQISNVSLATTGHDMTIEQGLQLPIPRLELFVYAAVALALIASAALAARRSRG